MKILWFTCAALAACGTRETLPLTTTSARIDLVPTEHAIRDMTSERCHRELACGNVGSKQKWDSLDACMTDTRRTTRDHLVSPSCDAIDAKALTTCLDDTRAQRCEEIANVAASCASAPLCRHVP